MKLNYRDILSKPQAAGVVERLMRYAKVETTSDRHIEDIPSTPSQWNLAKLLKQELEAFGIKDLSLDDHCYLIARLPASPGMEGKPSIGLMAHLDTSSEVSGADVKPRLVKDYDGKPLALSPGYVLDPQDLAELAEYVGDSLVVTDGTTLLGADDKAGIAEIMTAVELLLKHPEIKHGPLEIIFTPDEETGKGMNLFPLPALRSKACYTLDGGRLGEIEAECFNAYEAKLVFTGRSAHPGYARGIMVNALLMAATFATMLPRSESPEATDGWFGYFYAQEISGSVESAKLDIILRDYTEEGMERRIALIKALAAAIEAQFPGGKVAVEINKQYLNMRKKLDESPKVLELLFEAARQAGAEPYSKPIRGGTDGARLTEMGVPTPNLFAGMHSFHSRFEWASVSEMTIAVDTIVELVKLWAK